MICIRYIVLCTPPPLSALQSSKKLHLLTIGPSTYFKYISAKLKLCQKLFFEEKIIPLNKEHVTEAWMIERVLSYMILNLRRGVGNLPFIKFNKMFMERELVSGDLTRCMHISQGFLFVNCKLLIIKIPLFALQYTQKSASCKWRERSKEGHV